MRRSTAVSPVPPPPTPAEKHVLLHHKTNSHKGSQRGDSPLPALERITSRVSDVHYSYIRVELERWSLSRFTFDWEGNWDDQFNQAALQFFLKLFDQAIIARQYGISALAEFRDPTVITSITFAQFKALARIYKAQIENPNVLEDRHHESTLRKSQQDVSAQPNLINPVRRLTDVFVLLVCFQRAHEYLSFLKLCGTKQEIASIFQRRNYAIMGSVETVHISSRGRSMTEKHVTIPAWWSEKTHALMCVIEN